MTNSSQPPDGQIEPGPAVQSVTEVKEEAKNVSLLEASSVKREANEVSPAQPSLDVKPLSCT